MHIYYSAHVATASSYANSESHHRGPQNATREQEHEKKGKKEERVTSMDAHRHGQNISRVLALPVDQFLVRASIKMITRSVLAIVINYSY